MSELNSDLLSSTTTSAPAANLFNINTINDKCIENLTQNLNIIKKSIKLHQQAAALNDAEQEIYENHYNEQLPTQQTVNFNCHEFAVNKPGLEHLDPRVQKQLSLLNQMNKDTYLAETPSTSHELYINPIVKNINQFALESCELEKKIAAKFNKKPNHTLGNTAYSFDLVFFKLGFLFIYLMAIRLMEFENEILNYSN